MNTLVKHLYGLFAVVFALSAAPVDAKSATTTVTWDFTNSNVAAGNVNLEGISASVDSDVEGYALEIDATNGKFNSLARSSDAQVNATVFIKIPVYMPGDQITLTNYGGDYSIGYSIGAESGVSADTKVYVASKAEVADGFVTMTVTKSGYFKKIQVVYKEVVEVVLPGQTFTNKPVSVVWDFNSATDYATPSSVVPAEAFSLSTFDLGGKCTVNGVGTSSNLPNVTFVKVLVGSNGNKDSEVAWKVKPAKGLSFTPTKVSGKINRGATDAQNSFIIKIKQGDGESRTLATYTAARYNKTSADDSYKANDNYANSFEINISDAEASTDEFALISTVGVGSTKEAFFSDIHIEGFLNGTVQEVEKFSVSANPNIAGAGSVSVYPLGSSFERGTNLTCTATDIFGYDFVNWTDADNQVVSTDKVLEFSVDKNVELTANFVKVDEFELNVDVVGGNDYMVEFSPAPVVVNGKNMYEAGQKVELTAVSNKVVTFNSWSNGETQAQIEVTMDADVSLSVNYSADDYLAVWDFYRVVKQDRVADFATDGNEAASLSMFNEAGESVGWLDKSVVGGGFEGQPAAVCWVVGDANGDVGHHYWQTKVDASNFSSIKVASSMAYNYNTYTTQDVLYSIDGTEWKLLGQFVLPGVKKWVANEFELPADANNQPNVYIRWAPNKQSAVAGSASKNDGIALGAIYITGTPRIIDDGKAPVLVASVPEDKANTASANGKIVLSFDEKIKTTNKVDASLSDGRNSISLTPVVSGRSLIFEYKGLAYATKYTFRLGANSVADLTDNLLAEDVVVEFSTKVRPVVAKKLYDFVVPTDGTLSQAFDEANNRADQNSRFRIFVAQGDYTLPASKSASKTVEVELKDGSKKVFSYPDPTTVLSASNVSIVGPGLDEVVIDNECPTQTYLGKYGEANISEGISNGDVLLNTGSNNYFQGITIKRTIGDATGRDVAFQDRGNKTVFKDACLWGYQDTYVSNNQNGRYYFEGGVLRGRTDYLCGKGDVVYNEVVLQQCGKGGYLAVPSVPKQYGYVFFNCYIKKETSDVTYYLGRPWGSGTPTAIFINTEVEAAPIAAGWDEMNGGWPDRMAEYNTHLSSGTIVSLENRKKVFASSHSNNPVLSAEEAAAYTIDGILGEDDWDPTALTEQASAPTNVKLVGNLLQWDENDYALLFAVCKNGKVVDFTLENSYVVDDPDAVYSVRAANEMGGLGEASLASAGATSALDVVLSDSEVVSVEMYDLMGRRVVNPSRGLFVLRVLYSDGSVVEKKVGLE